jgi:DNA repair protein RadC
MAKTGTTRESPCALNIHPRPGPPPTRLRDLPAADLPRERLRRVGPAALATTELLAILLATGRTGASALDLGRDLLARHGLRGLARTSVDEICQLPGCGPAKAVRVLAALELGRRLSADAHDRPVQVTSPSEAAELLQSEMALLEQEHLRVVLLNMKNHVLGVHEVYKGSVSASLVRVAEVFREAVRRNCPAIIVAHNHPSGDPAPSAEDIHITRQMAEAGRLLDIELLDHIIIGRRQWVSLRERGLGFP